MLELFPERQKLLDKIITKTEEFNFTKTEHPELEIANQKYFEELRNVFLIESDFGTGKTYFARALTKTLLDKNIDTVYFSAWENDYYEQPLNLICNKILEYYRSRIWFEKIKNQVEEFAKHVYKIFKIFGLDKFIEYTFYKLQFLKQIPQFINYICELKNQRDPITEFKKSLTALIKKTDSKKLVLIIDELDRCRPDYAMKILETTKHFFDIDGIIVFYFANRKALNHSLQAMYNFKEESDGENYFVRFFVEEIKLSKIDYSSYIKTKLKEKFSFDIKEEKDVYNSEYSLYLSLNKLSTLNNITCRQFNLIFDYLFEFYKKYKKYDSEFYWDYIVNEIFAKKGFKYNKDCILYDIDKYKKEKENKLKYLKDGFQLSNTYELYNFATFGVKKSFEEKYVSNTSRFSIFFEKIQENKNMINKEKEFIINNGINLKDFLLNYLEDIEQQATDFKNKYGDTDTIDLEQTKANIDECLNSIIFIDS